jgi:hypothetical protein
LKKTKKKYSETLWGGPLREKAKKHWKKQKKQYSRSVGIGALPKEALNISCFVLFFFLFFWFVQCFFFFSKGPSPMTVIFFVVVQFVAPFSFCSTFVAPW